jgi:hypothetical protein
MTMLAVVQSDAERQVKYVQVVRERFPSVEEIEREILARQPMCPGCRVRHGGRLHSAEPGRCVGTCFGHDLNAQGIGFWCRNVPNRLLPVVRA